MYDSPKDWFPPGVDPSFSGLTIDELNRYLPALQTQEDLHPDPAQLSEGIYQAEIRAGLSRLPERTMDLILIHPPENPVEEIRSVQGAATWQDVYEWHRQWLKECQRIVKAEGVVALFCSWQSSGMYQSLLSEYFQVPTRITWRKSLRSQTRKAGPFLDQIGDIWLGSLARPLQLEFPEDNPRGNLWADIVDWQGNTETDETDLPEQVVERLLRLTTTKLDWVLDPFMGRGIAGVVAKKLGRRYIGLGTSQDQCLLAMKRIDQT
ncbi:MAG: site-specific DNA-methyltransferase [Candidatus Neomarinimicrobiota bacterium]|nr:MAG: site-specific DNA-methyltransferase [Candidatus Neomarinimicrobiota bacterium]